MQNTSKHLFVPHIVQRDVNTARPASGQAKPSLLESCGFTRREVRALVAEMLG